MIKHNDHYLREIKIKVKYSACYNKTTTVFKFH